MEHVNSNTARVLIRFKLFIAAGVVVAAALTFFSMYSFGPGGLRHRQQEQWASYTTLFVTQSGFPWGSLGPSQYATEQQKAAAGAKFADPNRLASLAVLYAQLANSDAVRQRVLQGGPIDGQIETAPVLAVPGTTDTLPFVSIAGISDTPAHAAALAQRETSALLGYLHDQQQANAIPVSQRVMLQQVNKPGNTKLLKGRKKSTPIVVFLATVLLVIGLAHVLDRLRPQNGSGRAAVPASEAA